jgi:MFS family permease
MVTADTRNFRREFAYFLLLVAALGVASGLWETSFNNYLSDTFNLSAKARGGLEFPRELPGLLVVFLGGALFFLSEIRLGFYAAVTLAIGFLGVAAWGSHWWTTLFFMFLWSVGNHMMMPVTSTINLSLAPPGGRAASLGRVGAITGVATIIGAGIVSLGQKRWHLDYHALFVVAACCALVGALAVSRLRPLPHRGAERPKLLWKERYSLYYLLCVFSGARKQVFVTFGPWVLIRLFGEPASTIANLWIVASAISIFFQPLLGKLIDRLGERTILRADALLLVAVCLGYGFARHLPLAHPVYVVYACYVLDNVLFACGMARATYVDKIAERQSDIHATLSLGVSIDHAVSMTIPFFAGILWAVGGENRGYPYVFLCAALIAVGNFIVAGFIRTKPGPPVTPEVEVEALTERAATD